MKKNVLLICLFLWLGCAATKKQTADMDIEESKKAYDESFDPLSLNDDDIVIPSAKSDDRQGVHIKNETAVNDSGESKEVNGFRVQILQTTDIEKATITEQRAKGNFSSKGHNVYLVFHPPVYKVRVGDFETRREAERLKEMAEEVGYRQSLVVRSKVLIKSPGTDIPVED